MQKDHKNKEPKVLWFQKKKWWHLGEYNKSWRDMSILIKTHSDNKKKIFKTIEGVLSGPGSGWRGTLNTKSVLQE